MKNFKLLLATTALLSVGTMGANAANPSKDMNVDVEIVVADSMSVVDHLDFGRWVVPKNITSITLSMDSTGAITPNVEGATKVGNSSQRGWVQNVPCDTLLLPETVYLTLGAGHTKGATSGVGTLTNLGVFTAPNNNGASEPDCYIYGDVTINEQIEGDKLQSRKYSAKFTITAMLGLD